MTTLLSLLGTFCGAYLGVRMATSPIGLLGELRVLVLLPAFLWDAVCGRLPTDADVARARAELEALHQRSPSHSE